VPLPPEALAEQAGNIVRSIHPEGLLQTVISSHREVTLVVDKARIVEIVQKLRDLPELSFTHLSDVTAVDYYNVGREPRFDVVYHLYSFENHHWIRLRVPVGEDQCSIDTITGLWSGAAFMERETYDMFGIGFNGHDGLSRILMPDNWEGHPLRKDFPLGGAKSFYYKQDTEEYAGEPDDLVPRMRVQDSDV
jgi:NADH-quinone oxidoreductase subunit C